MNDVVDDMPDEGVLDFQEELSQHLSSYMQATDPDDRSIDGFVAFITAEGTD